MLGLMVCRFESQIMPESGLRELSESSGPCSRGQKGSRVNDSDAVLQPKFQRINNQCRCFAFAKPVRGDVILKSRKETQDFPNCNPRKIGVGPFGSTHYIVQLDNSRQQNPCQVAGYVAAECLDLHGGTPYVTPLDSNHAYSGPGLWEAEDSDLCKCNTVIYSLLSACARCQGAQTLTWHGWSSHCTELMGPSILPPHPLSNDTCIPFWAMLDVTFLGHWDEGESKIAGSMNFLLLYSSIV
ncbi:hypothetical protein BGW80DRAFT_1254938 [Lactifluus volemus]|nr:hypothetical protein BGW80DRAFT_1254938 [Lactifluus volemus]